MFVAIAWMLKSDPRLNRQQNMLARKLLSDGHYLLPVSGEPRPYLGDLLVMARKAAGNGMFFAFSNADVVPFVRLSDVAKPGGVVGLSRVESNGQIFHAVDLYIFSTQAWDKYYANDIPKMKVGSHATDWWLSRLAHKHGIYQEIVGLRHESHPRTDTSKGVDAEGKAGEKEWIAFARRQGLPEGNIPNLKKNSVE